MYIMGWYVSKTQRSNGVSKWDTYGQNLNYHEGWTGCRNRSYDRKAWLKRVARQVQARAARFGAQYRSCEKELNRGGLFGVFCRCAGCAILSATREGRHVFRFHTLGVDPRREDPHADRKRVGTGRGVRGRVGIGV